MKVVLLLEVLMVVLVVQICPERESANMVSLFAVELSQASPQSVCSKANALQNMRCMSVTLDTSHLERSPLNDDAE